MAPAQSSPSLASGWNTWSTRSVLSHVLLPEAFALELSFCHYGMLTVIRDAAFGLRELGATPGVRLAASEVKPKRVGLKPGRHAYDASYTAVTVLLGDVTITVESARVGERDLVLLVRSTRAAYRAPALVVEAGLLWNRPGHVDQEGSRQMTARVPGGSISVHCTTEPECDANAGYRSPYWVFPLTQSIGLSVGASRSLAEVTALVDAARAAEAAVHARYGELSEAHAAYQACLAWNTVYEPSFERVITTASRPWNVLRFGYAIFCWDSFFFCWLLAADNPALARNCALETFRESVGGRFVPNIVNGSGRRSWDRSQPPVGSLCVLALHETAPDRAFLKQIWPSLLAWNRWWHEERRNSSGLLSWGSQAFLPHIGDLAEFLQPATARGAALESGLDNSPMYDDVPLANEHHLMALSDVGLASLYVTDCEALAQLALELGLHDEARELTARAAQYRERIQTLWNGPSGIFQNRRTDTDEFNPRVSPTSFYPMLAGAATQGQTLAMVTKHLLNEQQFWGEWVIPSVPRSDPAFAEQHYVRGCIWAPLNFLVYLGLKRAGQAAPARELAARSRALFERNWQEYGGVFENYSALTGGGTNAEFCDPLCTWSGLMVLMELIETGRLALPSILRPVS